MYTLKTLSYWERINEMLVELYVLLKYNMITLEEFKKLRLSISKGSK